jgi:hypothetical protein
VFWPVAESAQADYEQLRAAVLADEVPATAAWLRFNRHGLAGLIEAPVSAPMFTATLTGARRPAWTPHTDPRHDELAAVFVALVAASEIITEEIAR